jgi:hypothetical protein
MKPNMMDSSAGYDVDMSRVAIAMLGIASVVGCCPAPTEIPYTFEDWVPYAYASFERDGNVLAKGKLSIAPLRPGSRRFMGRWDVKAVAQGEHSWLHTGGGMLDGRVSGQRMFIEFHPDTAGTDRGFELEGELTSEGAKGEWGYCDIAGDHPKQGSFVLKRVP